MDFRKIDRYLKSHGWNVEIVKKKMYGITGTTYYYTKYKKCAITRFKCRNTDVWSTYYTWDNEHKYGECDIYGATEDDIKEFVEGLEE